MRTIVFAILGLLAVPVLLRGETGALDSGFGAGGYVALPLGAANAIAWQTNGTMLVGSGFGVARLLQDGGLDPTFGDGGVATIRRSTNQTASVTALVVQPDGKIVVSVGDNLARLLSSGTLDTEFGQGGFALGLTAANRSDSITALQLQPDGKIIAGGVSALGGGGGSSFLVLRVRVDGINDPDFGNRGRAMTTFGSSLAVGRTIALQGDGGIVIGGGVLLNNHLVFGIARFTATGALDVGFGNAGEVVVVYDGATFSQINGVALQSDGRIIGAGIANGDNAADFAMVRLLPDGSLDDSFGNQGIQRTDLSGGSRDIGGTVAVTPNGKILVAGSTGPDVFKRKFALARYHPDGGLDDSFGQGGFVITQFPQGTADEAYEMALSRDGRVILAGRASVGDVEGCGLVRYHVDDLGAVETASPDPAAVGETIYYSFLVENHRSEGVSGVRLTDQLPSSVKFQSAFSTQGGYTRSGNLVVFDLGSLTSGGQASVTIFATMQATAHLCDSAVVSANEVDPALTNSASACALVDPLREKPQNLAVTAIRAPKRVTLSDRLPETTRLVAVELENRSPRTEQITDLTGLVDLEVRSLTNACPDLVPVLLTERPQPQVPVFLSPKAKLKVYFQVTFSKDCVPDAGKTKPTERHNDYEYVALAHHDVVDDNRDTFPADDVCPRRALGGVTTAGKIIKDEGCGGKIFHAGFGAAVVTDVVVK